MRHCDPRDTNTLVSSGGRIRISVLVLNVFAVAETRVVPVSTDAANNCNNKIPVSIICILSSSEF
jgi:hypothetical protein